VWKDLTTAAGFVLSAVAGAMVTGVFTLKNGRPGGEAAIMAAVTGRVEALMNGYAARIEELEHQVKSVREENLRCERQARQLAQKHSSLVSLLRNHGVEIPPELIADV
jgi:cell shape-determining protein MreC